MPVHDDHDRAAILARRQRFIALALSSLSVACTGRPSRPQPCLSPPMRDTQGEQPPIDGESATDANATDASEPDATATEDAKTNDTELHDAKPQPCLKVRPR